MKYFSKSLVAASIAVSMLGTAQAASIIVYNTGLGVGGSALAAGDGQTDANYSITASGIPAALVGNQGQTYFNPAYLAENPASRWISYSGSPFGGVGTFTLTTTFDLTGLDPTSASISGLWGVDNEGEIFLNNVTTGLTLLGTTVNNFNQLYAFTLSSGFVSGINTLSFRVNDTGSPAALRVDGLTGTANLVGGAVPEPGTWALILSGFGIVGGALRIRRRKINVTFA